jgi:acetyl esterase/lipase
MDASPSTLLRLLLPKTPLILKTAFLHSLSISATASKCDLKTALLVNILRSMLDVPTPVGKQQHVAAKDRGIKGPMWVSQTTFSIDDGQGAKEAVIRAIDGLKQDGSSLEYTVPDPIPVQVEWTGHRGNVDANAVEPSISEGGKYTKLMSEAKSPVTVLYFHGGAYTVCDPCSHRNTTARLAKLTSGRVCSVRYRLAPQNPFPSALLDALVTYLSLLSPPPGSLHEAVDPSHIVFAGDSAGGNLCLVLLQLLLELRRQSLDASITFHGRFVPLHLPVGLSLNSPWCDISRSLPSTSKNAPFDYLPAHYSELKLPDFPPDHIWPTSPPRVDIFTAASMLSHPLVSPVVLAPEKWKDAPPVFMCLGQELLADEIRVTARRIQAAGSTVVIEAFEGMPHCFAMMLPDHPASKRCFDGWAGFTSKFVDEKGSVTSIARSINPTKGLKEEEVAFEALTELKDEEVSELIRETVRLKVQMEKELQINSASQNKNPARSESSECQTKEETVQAKARL